MWTWLVFACPRVRLNEGIANQLPYGGVFILGGSRRYPGLDLPRAGSVNHMSQHCMHSSVPQPPYRPQSGVSCTFEARLRPWQLNNFEERISALRKQNKEIEALRSLIT